MIAEWQQMQARKQFSPLDWPTVALGATAGTGVAAVIGRFIAWWFAGRNNEMARLREWDKYLRDREKSLFAELEKDLAEVRSTVKDLEADLATALRYTALLVTEVKQLNPDSPLITIASDVLHRSFPIDHALPHDMNELLARINLVGGDGGER